MSRSLTIIDADYKNWVKELSQRYRRSQIKAAVKVNNEVLKFYWELGRDIVGMDADNKYGSGFYKCLSLLKILTTQIFSNLLKICSRFLGATIFS